jgi:hypothetical protein
MSDLRRILRFISPYKKEISLLMIGASILSATLSIANTVYSVRASRGFEADLREAIFKKV